MINKLINRFWRSKLGLLIIEFMIKLEQRRIEKNLNNEFKHLTDTSIIPQLEQDAIKYQYKEALTQIKRVINSQLDARTADNYDKILKTKEDLIGLAKVETEEQKKFRELKESMYIFKGKDVKSITDTYKMVDKRISDYNQLQEYNEQRQLIRQIKSAHKQGNTQLAERLTNEWRQKYNSQFN